MSQSSWLVTSRESLSRFGINYEQDGPFRAMADALGIAAAQVAQQRDLAIGMDLDAVLRAAFHAVIAQQA
jgi:hypothetical protein